MQRQGLAGEFHRWLISKHEADPGAAAAWREQIERDKRAIWPSGKRPGGIVSLYLGQVESFLDERWIVVDESDLFDLVKAAGLAALQAKDTLARNAEGDYSPDAEAQRFPGWDRVEPTLNIRTRSLVVDRDWDAYVRERGISLGSQKRWRPVLDKLARFLGSKNLALLSPDDLLRWKAELMSEKKQQSTIKEVYFAAASSFFNWGSDNRKVQSNPFEEVRVRVPKPVQLRPKSYGDDEARLVLSETLRPPRGRETSELGSAKRWVPWLCSYMGARVGEVTQIRCKDLRREQVGDEDVWVLHITPEAGTVKTGIARDVPLHPHLVQQGFPEFVRRRGTAAKPVFYDPARRRGGKEENPQSHKVGQRLAEWVRDIGAVHPEVDLLNPALKPNHAWRHRFNDVARDCRMILEIRDAIKGHAPRTEGERYGHFSVKAKWEEIKRIPRFEVPEPTGPAPVSRRARREYENKKANSRSGISRVGQQGTKEPA